MTEENTQGFSESWLKLREPADHAARNVALSDRLVNWCKPRDALRVVELGAGTGSNLRYLMPSLGHGQQWLLMDNDASLLDHLPRLLEHWADTHHAKVTLTSACITIEHTDFSATVSTRVIDLARDLDELIQQEIHVLTASALLDLTSATWLEKLASIIHQQQCASLFVLNYDGLIEWQPTLSSDTTVSKLLNQHQLGDKGFGDALGPEAGKYFAAQLEQRGCHVFTDASHWQIDESMTALQLAIIEGWAPAAIEQSGEAAEQINTWLAQRNACIVEGVSQLRVGHCDVLSLP